MIGELLTPPGYVLSFSKKNLHRPCEEVFGREDQMVGRWKRKAIKEFQIRDRRQ